MTTLSEKLRAARETWAVGPVEARALVRATGKDAKDYLHRMSTQDLNRLRPGESAYSTFLNAKGHLLAEGHVLAQEEGLLLDLAPQALPDALAHLERLVIMDEVVFEDLSSALRVVPVLGPEAARRVEGRAPGAQRLAHDRRGTPGVDVILPPQEAEALRAELVAEGAVALEDSDLEALRILGGVPRFGADVDSTRLPMEAGLTRAAISFTKGCYIGQEVVLRATARGHLQRGLVQLALPAGAGPGTRLTAAGQEVGVVTSAADTPEGRIGLGYLRRAHWTCGAAVDAGGEPATVRRVLVEEPEL
ncbi:MULTISPECIES: CAF17-like 4Fe-4S cluster assembly/insertion protein YgfZ [Anaeromyxobacter]|uniref:CAF17-like 4Fe-4S cluster assembly/insertion protein YgfZ n=1 Tax=Anaeromyxobacter TaxID=161492 RepID=UPI001F57F01F|nr:MULTISPECIES: folate-binding protein [unclassified Anaeromyxobacter]